MGREIPQHAVQTALLLEDIKDQPDDALRLRVWVQLVIAVGAPHVAQGRLMQEVPALGLMAPALEEATGQAPKLLSNLTGVDSVQSGLFDFNFTARGFNKPLNRRVLVLVDGRDTSFPFLGSQDWSAFPVPLGELQSVDFVRGPRSAAIVGTWLILLD